MALIMIIGFVPAFETNTKQNILQQASQSMLAQANQQTQGILQLLG